MNRTRRCIIRIFRILRFSGRRLEPSASYMTRVRFAASFEEIGKVIARVPDDPEGTFKLV